MNPWMRDAKRARCCLLLFCIFTLGAVPSVNAEGADVRSVATDQMDQMLAGQQVIEFIILPTGEISAKDGSVVALKDLPKHLKRVKAPRDAFYLFWLVNPNQLEVARDAIERCTRYGATKFAVRQMPATQTPADSPATDDPAGPKTKKTLVLVPGTNPEATAAGEKAPTFAGRPAELRPPPLPARVRCQFTSDEAVVSAADRARALLLSTEPINTDWVGQTIMMQPGAWKHLRKQKALAHAQVISTGSQLRSGPVKLEGSFLRTQEETMAAVQRVREMIRSEGGAEIRALTAAEMDAWWTFIAFDIEEPVFVLATKGRRFRFIVHFSDDGRLTLIDELNALPKQ